jgi:murein DD-endopeptidase MepM/ murein hydrolase activator NlpD
LAAVLVVATVAEVARGGWRLVGAGLVAALVVTVLSTLTPPVRPPAALAQTTTVVRAQTMDTSEEESQLLDEVDASLSRKKSLDDKVADLDRQLASTQSDLATAQSQLDALQSRQRGTEKQLAVVRAQMAAAQQQLQEQAVSAYIGRSDAGRWDDLLRASSLDQLATKQSYLSVVGATQTELIASKERLRDETNDLLGDLKVARDKAQAERDVVDGQRANLQSERDSQAAVRYQVSVEIADYQSLLQEVLSRKDEFQAQAQDLAAQSEAVAEELGRRQAQAQSDASSSSSSGTGGLADPLPHIEINSGFGYRVHPIYGTVLLHTGDDLAADSGDPIHAAADGVVVSAGWLGGYGNATVIDHGGGLATLYGHQSVILVSPGQHVVKGQVIGKVGCTGSCTGPHLHFEVRINGNPVDPTPYL